MDRWKDRAMGAAPVLIMLAAVGVDYGWQPDGTTSSRGDNIEYIVQISPDQLQQMRSIGEITSAVDPSVQGRVSRIVVKIGNDPLPKIAGRSIASETASNSNSRATAVFAGQGDDAMVSIPEILDSVAIQSPTYNSSRQGSASKNASLMKPDPQGGGFSMPESMQTGAQSAYDQVRSRVTEAANQPDAQARSAVDSPVNSFTQSANDAAARAASSLQNSFSPQANPNAANPNAGRSAAPISPDPLAGRDNRWADLSARAAATAGQAGPSTDPASPAAHTTTPWSSGASPGLTSSSAFSSGLSASGLAAPGFAGTSQASDPRSISTPYSGVPNDYGATAPPSLTRGVNTPSLQPTDPKWSGYGTSSNFGTLPGGLTAPGAGFEPAAAPATATNTNSTLNDPRYTTTSNATTAAGYRQDAAGNWYNSSNQLVNRDGQPIDRFGNRLDSNGFPVDQYNRRVDENNRVITDPLLAQTTAPRSPYAPGGNTTNTGSSSSPYANLPASGTQTFNAPFAATAADQFGSTNPYDPNAYLPTTLPQSPYGQNLNAAQLAQQQLAQQQTAQQLAEAQRQLLRYQERDKAETRLVNFDDDIGSASDLRSTNAQLAAKAERDRIAAAAALTSKPRSVAAQPFFNFVLLISLVGNAYLIFETNNLRRKFRNMISSVRSSKIITQPVA